MLQAIMQSLINIHLYIKNKHLPGFVIRATRRVTLCIAHSAKGNLSELSLVVHGVTRETKICVYASIQASQLVKQGNIIP